MNVNKLKAKVVEKGINIETLASKLGISNATMYRKLNNSNNKLTVGEAVKIKNILEIQDSEAIEIFLS